MVNYDYLYDKEYFREKIDVQHCVDKKLSYASYENAYIVPLRFLESGVYTEQKKFVEHSDLFGCCEEIQWPYGEMAKIDFCNENVVYVGGFFQTWGHAITDVISRLWFLRTEEYLNKFRHCRIVFANTLISERVESVYRLLEILGLDESKFDILDKPMQFKHTIIPDSCFWEDRIKGGRYFTCEYKALIQTVRKFQKENFIEDKSCEKIYFSKKKYGIGKNDVGERKLESFFESQGYKIVYPEMYSFDEQLNMLANCYYFASTVGSTSHNTVFLPENANVILIPKAYFMNAWQLALDEVVDLDVNYVDSSLSVLVRNQHPTGGPFYYYVSENLKNFCGIREPCDGKFYRKQLGDFKNYVKYARGGYTKT